MARTPSKRWDAFEHQVMKTIGTRETIPAGEFAANMFLAYRRQHAKFVRLVKKHMKDVKKVQRIVGKDDAHAQGMLDGIECILAALQQGGEK